MKIYKYISTVKAKDPQGKKPTHYIKAKVNMGDPDNEGEFVASLWAKEYTRDGVTNKFLSGEMKSQYTDHTDPSKSRKGFVIVEEAELNKLLNAYKDLESGEVNVKTPDGIDYPEAEINPNDVPF